MSDCSLCNGTGWKPANVAGVRRVDRCECWRAQASDRLMRDARIPPRYAKCEPLLLRSLSYVAQEQAIMPEAVVGSLAPSLERLQVHAPLTIHTPSGNVVTIPRLDAGEASGPLGILTDLGIYDVTANSSTLTRFAVNGSPSESFLRPLRREDVERAARQGDFAADGLIWVDDPRSLERLVVQARLGAELWPFVVIGALAVAVIELLVARSVRSHGPTESAPPVQSIT